MSPGIIGDRDQLLFSRRHLVWAPALIQPDGLSLDHGRSVEQVVASFKGQRDIVRQDQVADLAAIVRPLGAVDKRASLQGDFSEIGLYCGVRSSPADGHGQVDFDGIIGRPGAADADKSLIEIELNRLAIDADLCFSLARVQVLVQISGHRTSERPSGDADIDPEFSRPLRVDDDPDLTVPGVKRLLLQPNFLVPQRDARFTRRKQVQVKIFAACRVHEARDLRDKADDIARTASAVEPGAAAVLAERFQRIRIEEKISAQRNPGEKAVVKCPLQEVDVFSLAVEQEHAVVPENEGDGSAGLAVSLGIGQFVGRAEALDPAGRPDPAGDIHLPEGDILPEPEEGLAVSLISRKDGHIGHA